MGEKLKQRLKQDKFTGIEHEALLNLFLANNFIKKKMDDVCQASGITSAQYNVLRILRGAYPEGYPRCEIIVRMIDQAPDVTRIIDNLEKQDLILRENSPEDRRLSITKITKKGLLLIENMGPEVDSLNKYLRDSLSEAEIIQLSEICEKIYPHGK
ncbi:MAG: MarR family winged helix-turn-helix transcriptional regulator [Bacteroidota bacterium]|jgi:DNA-binding MarR family transcriptional regulator|nr:MarR family transcriptional regulator [Ignavibacteria bacterium]HEX2963644.1 MarR family transcriptional regulator [Ignavibacteriales bacterium]MCU7498746.1 MarR family transcriptional regulator [Ignavibacteria bacterium]MCU7512060.1 MarR family transcriptional regulator [Ignavibacteria bacterium]MCU7520593.1 MarR family transcriptional regulator [Ignavibacteria bacterium]